MQRSFYSWLMSQRNPNFANEVQEFANRAWFDNSFPKQSTDFHEISEYLETNVSYVNLEVFDLAWSQYLIQIQ